MSSNNFLNVFRSISVSVAILLVSGAIFVFSLMNARASEFPDTLNASEIEGKLAPNSTMAVGKYMFAYQLVNDFEEKRFYHFVLVWDTETGKSKVYVRDGDTYKASLAQLPQAPLQ